MCALQQCGPGVQTLLDHVVREVRGGEKLRSLPCQGRQSTAATDADRPHARSRTSLPHHRPRYSVRLLVLLVGLRRLLLPVHDLMTVPRGFLWRQIGQALPPFSWRARYFSWRSFQLPHGSSDPCRTTLQVCQELELPLKNVLRLETFLCR